VLLSTLFSRPY